jgi:flagellar basal-body rod protein FlgC
MGMFDSFRISASGMTAQRLWMDVIADNLANANTTRGADGKPYARKQVVLSEIPGSFDSALQGVQVTGVVDDPAPGRRVYDPGHPDADQQGYVTLPNVTPVTEMVDLISASRGYEADTQAMNAGKAMFLKALDILR